VFDAEATLRPRMAGPGGWQPARDDPAHRHPRHRGLMASARQRASPVPKTSWLKVGQNTQSF